MKSFKEFSESNKPVVDEHFTIDREEFDKIASKININAIMNKGPRIRKKASRNGYSSLSTHEKNIIKAHTYIMKSGE